MDTFHTTASIMLRPSRSPTNGKPNLSEVLTDGEARTLKSILEEALAQSSFDNPFTIAELRDAVSGEVSRSGMNHSLKTMVKYGLGRLIDEGIAGKRPWVYNRRGTEAYYLIANE